MFKKLVKNAIFLSLFLLSGFTTWANDSTISKQEIETLVVDQDLDCESNFNAKSCSPFSLDAVKVNSEEANLSSIQKKSKQCVLVNLLFLFIEDDYIQVKYNTSCFHQFHKPETINYYIYGLHKILI